VSSITFNEQQFKEREEIVDGSDKAVLGYEDDG